VFFEDSLFLDQLFCSFTCVFNFSPEPQCVAYIVSLKSDDGAIFPLFFFRIAYIL
jgi:hypothetical protein